MLRHIKGFFKRHSWKYVAGIIVLLIVDALQLVVPKILESFTDSLVKPGVGGYTALDFGIAIIILGIGIGLLRFLWRIFIIITAIRLETDIRSMLFSHLLTLPRTYFNKVKTGDIMARATNDIGSIRQAASGGVIAMVDAIFITLTSLIVMISDVSLEMTLIAIIPLPIILVTIMINTKAMFRLSRSAQEGFAMLSDKTQESFSGIRVIKSFSQEAEEHVDFNEKSKENVRRNLRLVRLQAMLGPLVTFISTLSTILAILIGSMFVLNGSITLGKFVSFLNYLELLTWPMMAFGFFMAMMQNGAASLERINTVLDETSDLVNPSTDTVIANQDIEIRNLSFTYPGESNPALKNINLTIPGGTSLGILGHTGSGKTTFISLLLKLYNVERGQIVIGGTDINDIPVTQLRNLFGVVPQDNFLFSDKISSNIALSSPEVDQVRVEESAKQASIHDEIARFPEGYETMLGEKGVNLSGGQKQRTSIARMLYKDAKISILDDSLSAVDTRTETAILGEMKKKREKDAATGRSAIIISHRISSLMGADQVVVFENGEIVEHGTHDSLVSKGGIYADIFRKQKLEEKIQAE